jgi:hypothetical protein
MNLFPARGLKPIALTLSRRTLISFNESLPRKGTETWIFNHGADNDDGFNESLPRKGTVT